jgi:two-component system cell cycle sensor histidine kinase/response regulator CckA
VLYTGKPLLASPKVFEKLVEEGKIELIGPPSIDWLGVPLKIQERLIGVLVVQSYTKDVRYEESDLEVLKFVSHQIATAIERKQAQEALKKSEEKYRSLTNQLPVGIYRTTKNGKILQTNPALASILDFESVEELINSSATDVYVDLDIRKRQLKTMMDSKGIVCYEVEFETKKGKRIWVRDTGRVILDTNNEIDYIDGIIEDITEGKRVQEQFHQAQKMEAIGRLAGGVAHDLNNILSAIVAYPDLILMKLPRNSTLKKPIIAIQKSGQRAAAIVQDLLTLARRGVSFTEVVNINEIIQEYLKSPEFEKQKSHFPEIQIEVNLEYDLLNILGSPIHLTKTIMNLVSNALESIPKVGKIWVTTRNTLKKSTNNPCNDDYVLLIISDSGIGIAQKDLEKIFEPFYTKKKMGRSGTGLGMAVVWNTVKDHSGYINVESVEGKGTKFELYLPVTSATVSREKRIISINEYVGEGERIVVVDDIEEQREIATIILEKLGYSVVALSSGEEAMKYMETNSADLLILDMIMEPGIDGLETYRKILELQPGIRAIIASGFSETERVKEAQNLGAGTYIRKPYTMEKIGLAVRAELVRE